MNLTDRTRDRQPFVETSSLGCTSGLEVFGADVVEAHVVAWDKTKRKNALPDVYVTPNGTLVG